MEHFVAYFRAHVEMYNDTVSEKFLFFPKFVTFFVNVFLIHLSGDFL